MAAARFEIRRRHTPVRRRESWYVVLRGENGEVLSSSEKLSSHDAALTNVAAQKRGAPDAETYDVWLPAAESG